MTKRLLIIVCVSSLFNLAGCIDDTRHQRKEHKVEGNTKPVAAFDYRLDGQTVSFINHSSDQENDKLTYNWELGAAGESFAFEPRVKLAKGRHTIALTVSDGELSDSYQASIQIGSSRAGADHTAANSSDKQGTQQTINHSQQVFEHTGKLLNQNGNPIHSRFYKYKNRWREDQADIILSYQFDNGGWPKNNRYTEIGQGGTGVGATIDNGATTLELSFLADLYRKTGEIKYRDAVRKAMTYLLTAQYDNGGWPQFYPLKGGYADHVTFNDNAMIRVLTTIHYAAQAYPPFDTDLFNDDDRLKFKTAINKGIDYILKSQWVQNGKLTAWCAQHGASDYQPKKARAYELASLSGSESTGIIAFLMTQPQSDPIKASIKSALAWYRSANTVLANHKYDKRTEQKIVRSEGDRIWYRFYDLHTNKGFFSDRDGGTYYDLMAISAERRNGYSWAGKYADAILNYADSIGY